MSGKHDSKEQSLRGGLRKIGYAAAVISGAGAAAYTLSNALQRRDMRGFWMCDRRAAPPLAVQRELMGQYSDDSSSEESEGYDYKRRHTSVDVEQKLKKLENKMRRAMDDANMVRVQDIAQRIEELKSVSRARKPSQHRGNASDEEAEQRTREKLEDKMRRAMDDGNMPRIQELSQRIEELKSARLCHTDEERRTEVCSRRPRRSYTALESDSVPSPELVSCRRDSTERRGRSPRRVRHSSGRDRRLDEESINDDGRYLPGAYGEISRNDSPGARGGSTHRSECDGFDLADRREYRGFEDRRERDGHGQVPPPGALSSHGDEMSRRYDRLEPQYGNGSRSPAEGAHTEHLGGHGENVRNRCQPYGSEQRDDDGESGRDHGYSLRVGSDRSLGRQPPPAGAKSGAQADDRDRGIVSHSQSRSARKHGRTSPLSPEVLAAHASLRAGDLVKAQCPTTLEWHDATIRALRSGGLVEVRWHNPGSTPEGRPFHRYGDVFADKVRLTFRKEAAAPERTESASQPEASALNTTASSAAGQEMSISQLADGEEMDDPPDGLQVGDECFALGSFLEKKWFKVRLIAVRAKDPRLRIEYVATLDGDSNTLVLPEPKKSYVHDDEVRRNMPLVAQAGNKETRGPEVSEKPQPAEKGVTEQAPATSSEKAPLDGARDDAIDEDLMCAVCSRPDDDAHMLVCDCKLGYHIYCLTPPLGVVPEGDWLCPKCNGAAETSAVA